MNLLPSITAAPSNPSGLVSHLPSYSPSDFTPPCAILCRTTAPLISFAYSLLQRDIPARVLGRDIGAQLTALVEKMAAVDLPDLSDRLFRWHSRECNLLLAKAQSTERIDDQYGAILFFIEALDENSQSIPDLLAKIDLLFSEDIRPSAVLLMTIHRSKGLEWSKVFILDPHLIPSKYAKTPRALEQERNLAYVAVTRSMHTLHYINSACWANPK